MTPFQDGIENEASRLLALMVDDDPVALQVTGNLLSRAGFKVLFAKSAGAALEIFSRSDFHVALVDLHLEDVSGVDLIRYLREAPNGPKVRIVAWTGSADEVILQAALDAGADDVYLKTTPPDVIAAKFRRLAAKSGNDVDRDVQITSMREDINTMMEVQGQMLDELKALRLSIEPVQDVVADWRRRKELKQKIIARLRQLRGAILLAGGVAGAVGAIVAVFNWMPKP